MSQQAASTVQEYFSRSVARATERSNGIIVETISSIEILHRTKSIQNLISYKKRLYHFHVKPPQTIVFQVKHAI
jgi:hypothetical protein